MFRNLFNSISRGIGYSIGKFLFWGLLALLGAWLGGLLTITNVFAANFAQYDYELNAQLESFNFYDCDTTNCSSTTNKSFSPVLTINRPDKVSYYQNTASFTYGANYGAIWSTRTNLNFVQGQVYTISFLYANNKGYLEEPETAWISYSSGDEKIKVKELNFQAGQLGTCNMGGENFKYCGRLYLSFVAESNGMWFHFRVKPLATNSYSSGQFFINSEVGVYTLGTYDERTNLEIYNRLDSQLRSINSTLNSLKSSVSSDILDLNNNINNNLNSSANDIKNNQNSNQQQIINNQNSNTQNQISNENKNHEEMKDIYNNETENSDGTCKGVICNLKKVVKGIINLPGTIVNAVINALKSLFIPSDTSFITDFVDSIENKLGFIGSIPGQMIRFLLNLGTASWEEVTSITFPQIEFFGVCFWDSMEIDLSAAIGIINTFKHFTDFICVILCCNTLLRWYNNFTGGDS